MPWMTWTYHIEPPIHLFDILHYFEGKPDFYYRRKPTNPSDLAFPPRYWKFILTLTPPISASSSSTISTRLCFLDPRRLARVRLVPGPDPLACPPISQLGFDPLHNLPPPAAFATMVRRRRVPVKALLLDQTFSAGVGNWVADEVLYHARIHPRQYAHTLTEEECATLREKVEYVCRTAVECEADSERFPGNWLFSFRWGKGKGKGSGKLADGMRIEFDTVGGRTSAYVPELQKLQRRDGQPETEETGEEEDGAAKSGKKKGVARKGGKRKRGKEEGSNDDNDEAEEVEVAAKVPPKKRGGKTEKRGDDDAEVKRNIAPKKRVREEDDEEVAKKNKPQKKPKRVKKEEVNEENKDEARQKQDEPDTQPTPTQRRKRVATKGSKTGAT
ncbi:LOW QUALITY PROTEIN: hypothetical protein BC936DRAFT_141066 [Jimgerdemannia flammicorona]|uniref:Formamidopyrimidine-DNA glycosylase H2TH DNA-binding domain-containing protein n=1 Tax=Jimgerdemannia flammicorona TaxID=994334 RepID=A0A433A2X8_9FUNG|nr:LOW QUALITY PROTEIN: hypothetical protein BC936DRAFT_141066 [Jimgerdemannia flammicorona]